MEKRKRCIGLAFLGMTLLAAYGCSTPSPDAETSLQDSAASPLQEKFEFTTALPMASLTEYPEGFVEASLRSLDTASNHLTQLFFPQKFDDPAVNAVIRKYCEDYAKDYWPDRPIEEFAQSEFSMWVVDMHVTGDLLSIQWMEQSFYSGAAHFNHGNPCLNIHIKTQKRLYLDDLFSFSGTHSKARFCEVMDPGYPLDLNALKPGDLDRKLDLFVGKDSIALCFDDFERGPSMMQLKASLGDVKPFWSANAMRTLRLEAR
jgi:hypothetical protein